MSITLTGWCCTAPLSVGLTCHPCVSNKAVAFVTPAKCKLNIIISINMSSARIHKVFMRKTGLGVTCVVSHTSAYFHISVIVWNIRVIHIKLRSKSFLHLLTQCHRNYMEIQLNGTIDTSKPSGLGAKLLFSRSQYYDPFCHSQCHS